MQSIKIIFELSTTLLSWHKSMLPRQSTRLEELGQRQMRCKLDFSTKQEKVLI
jgi:hypothetical protein